MKASVTPTSYAVRIRNVQLLHVSFDVVAGAPSNLVSEYAEGPEVELELFVNRPAKHSLGIIFSVSSVADAPIRFRVAYAAEFQVRAGEGADSQLPLKTRLRGIAADVGPSMLYPYVRELLADLSGRAQVGPILLPFVPIPIEWEGERNIPDPPRPSRKKRPATAES
jgi:preprotein translocase subunit SecB